MVGATTHRGTAGEAEARRRPVRRSLLHVPRGTRPSGFAALHNMEGRSSDRPPRADEPLGRGVGVRARPQAKARHSVGARTVVPLRAPALADGAGGVPGERSGADGSDLGPSPIGDLSSQRRCPRALLLHPRAWSSWLRALPIAVGTSRRRSAPDRQGRHRSRSEAARNLCEVSPSRALPPARPVRRLHRHRGGRRQPQPVRADRFGTRRTGGAETPRTGWSASRSSSRAAPSGVCWDRRRRPGPPRARGAGSRGPGRPLHRPITETGRWGRPSAA